MNIDINATQLATVIFATGFVSMISLVLKLQIELTKAKKDIEYLTNEIKKLREIIEKCLIDDKL